MTKAVICTVCADIVSPISRNWETNRAWRWCECNTAGVRWRDGDAGLLEVTSFYGQEHVRVLGINNQFLVRACSTTGVTAEHWRELHAKSTETVDKHYLFHKDRRDCWAVIIKVGETGDVFFVSYSDAQQEEED